MRITVGCDTVFLPKFKETLERTPEILNKIFLESERENEGPESLAGIFSVKESVIKALELEAGEWRNILIFKKDSGKRKVELLNYNFEVASQDISVSHDGDYIFTVAVFLINDIK